jgi:hypothetical protein
LRSVITQLGPLGDEQQEIDAPHRHDHVGDQGDQEAEAYAACFWSTRCFAGRVSTVTMAKPPGHWIGTGESMIA